MSVRQVTLGEQTKDGRKWIFTVRYKDVTGKIKLYNSKKFSTRNEAKQAEKEFVPPNENSMKNNSMTFSDLCTAHFEYQKDKVKVTTLRNYMKRRNHMQLLDNIKLSDLNINHFENWRNYINSKEWGTKYKNDLYKYLKSVLNYGMKWYDYDFNSMYKKMASFNNPNEIKQEMLFWDYEEFKQFISVETDIKFKALYEALYYCGLRSGEVRGLTWRDIDINNAELSVNKNVVVNLDGKKYFITTPKTKSSYRTIPMPNVLIEDLKVLKNIQASYYGFDENWYVFGSHEPISKSIMRDRKNNNCRIAGVKQIRIHDFRHSCASLLINNGANITMVAKYLGHTKIDETLNTYTHMFKNKLIDIVETINNL